MIKEVVFPQSAFDNTWAYFEKNMITLSISRYGDWLEAEHNIRLGEITNGPNRYCFTISGEEKELALFLLRWS